MQLFSCQSRVSSKCHYPLFLHDGYIMRSFLNTQVNARARLSNLICLMGVKIEFLSIWNRNFSTIDARVLAIVSKSTIGSPYLLAIL